MGKKQEGCVDRLKVLSDETRLSVLRVLMEGPHVVNEICEKLSVEQSLLSHHLQTLRKAELVTTERKGKAIVYELAKEVCLPDKSGINLGCCKLSFDVLPPL